ncbi:polysaccharide deacetylase family protein [Phytohabitans kaempferiae]|uniref:Polysaccharide deacetylase family protein n=1 Tax=Phytohabitans kaempferiae TaxID=1620943 RepID=A0ABV6LYM2_9ACTN
MQHDCAVCRQRTDSGSAVEERFIDDQIAWPGSYRTAVNIVFNYQGNEAAKPGPNGRVDYETYTEQEYGRTKGIARVLRVLREREVKATFTICGAIAEHYPDTVLAIAADGHEIAGHGYHHEVVTNMPKEQEREIFQATLGILRQLTGAPVTGWRSCHQSPHTPELVLEEGLKYNSNSFVTDLPYLLTMGDRTGVEVVRQPFGDMRTYGRTGFGGDPEVAFEIWRTTFDTLHAESVDGPVYVPYSLHPFISGRPGRSDALAKLIDHVQGREGVWISTSDEVADAVLASAAAHRETVDA